MAHRVSAPTYRDAMPRRPRPPSPSSRAGAGSATHDTRHKQAGAGIERERGAAGDVDAALIENWALSYLGRFASSAENLRRVLRRRARPRGWARAGGGAAAPAAGGARVLAAGARRGRGFCGGRGLGGERRAGGVVAGRAVASD